MICRVQGASVKAVVQLMTVVLILIRFKPLNLHHLADCPLLSGAAERH
jgi:hypothetical protein